MNWRDHIEMNPNILGGKPVFKGTRLKVETVLRELTHGTPHAQIMKSYPNATPELIKAALFYATEVASLEYVVA